MNFINETLNLNTPNEHIGNVPAEYRMLHEVYNEPHEHAGTGCYASVPSSRLSSLERTALDYIAEGMQVYKTSDIKIQMRVTSFNYRSGASSPFMHVKNFVYGYATNACLNIHVMNVETGWDTFKELITNYGEHIDHRYKMKEIPVYKQLYSHESDNILVFEIWSDYYESKVLLLCGKNLTTNQMRQHIDISLCHVRAVEGLSQDRKEMLEALSTSNLVELYKLVYKAKCNPDKILDKYCKIIENQIGYLRKNKIEECEAGVRHATKNIKDYEERIRNAYKNKLDYLLRMDMLKQNDNSYKDDLFEMRKYLTITKNITLCKSDYTDRMKFQFITPVRFYEKDLLERILKNFSEDVKLVMTKVFLEEKYELYFWAQIYVYIDKTNPQVSVIRSDSNRLSKYNAFPQPHLVFYNCFGDNYPQITEALTQSYIGALMALEGTMMNLNFGDTVVTGALIDKLKGSMSRDKVFKCKETGEFVSYDDIMKKYTTPTVVPVEETTVQVPF